MVERLFQQLYNRTLINNVDRGVYVEYMIELALQELDPAWGCLPGWSMWDLENKRSGARIEVKQSAKQQTWPEGSPRLASAPRFGVAPTKRWDSEKRKYVGESQRRADLYIFAYHSEGDRDVADHRRPDQWEFYLVPERELPAQKGIGLKPVRSLGSLYRFTTLATDVTRVIAELPRL